MAQNLSQSTEHNILEAARQQFHQKGLAGARMQEIADYAGINKAMLHYYYSNKNQLFEAVLQQDMKTLIPGIMEILSGEMDLYEKIRQFADHYITTIQNHRQLPGFVINELSQNPDYMAKLVTSQSDFKPDKFLHQIEEAVKAGEIRETNPREVLANLASLCLFPFIAKPMMKAVLQMDEAAYEQFLENRKKTIPEFIIASLQNFEVTDR